MKDSTIIYSRDGHKQMYAQMNVHALLQPYQFVVGLVQHPGTGLFQIWISTTGFDIIDLSAHRRIVDAETDLQTVKKLIGSQDIYDERKLSASFARLLEESDEPPQPLPDQIVKQIFRAIVVKHESLLLSNW